MKSYLIRINANTRGGRCDITPIFRDYEAFEELTGDLSRAVQDLRFELVAGIDALGFILGTAVAMRLKKGFLAVRKGGKLPVDVDRVGLVDYSQREKTMELGRDSVVAGTRVLLVDDWVETGAQARAAIELIERQGGEVAGIAAIAIESKPESRHIRENYVCRSLTDGSFLKMLKSR